MSEAAATRSGGKVPTSPAGPGRDPSRQSFSDEPAAPAQILRDALFEEDVSEPVLVRVVGLSKLARLVDAIARDPHTQTSLTDEIATTLQDTLGARGAGAWLEARHTCPGSRGTVFTRSILGDLKLPSWRTWLESRLY